MKTAAATLNTFLHSWILISIDAICNPQYALYNGSYLAYFGTNVAHFGVKTAAFGAKQAHFGGSLSPVFVLKTRLSGQKTAFAGNFELSTSRFQGILTFSSIFQGKTNIPASFIPFLTESLGAGKWWLTPAFWPVMEEFVKSAAASWEKLKMRVDRCPPSFIITRFR